MAAANAIDRLERLRNRLSIKHELCKGMLGEFIGTGLMTVSQLHNTVLHVKVWLIFPLCLIV